jgi:hypothetical protein
VFIKNDQQLIGTYMWYMMFLDTCNCDDSFDPDPGLKDAYEHFMGMCGDFQRQVEKHIDAYLKWRNSEEVQILLPLQQADGRNDSPLQGQMSSNPFSRLYGD